MQFICFITCEATSTKTLALIEADTLEQAQVRAAMATRQYAEELGLVDPTYQVEAAVPLQLSRDVFDDAVIDAATDAARRFIAASSLAIPESVWDDFTDELCEAAYPVFMKWATIHEHVERMRGVPPGQVLQ